MVEVVAVGRLEPLHTAVADVVGVGRDEPAASVVTAVQEPDAFFKGFGEGTLATDEVSDCEVDDDEAASPVLD